MRRLLSASACAIALLLALSCSSEDRPVASSEDITDGGTSPQVDVGAAFDICDTGEELSSGCRSNEECDDDNPCTLDICDVRGICVHSPIDTVCDDEDACTVNEHCEDGHCVHEPELCEEDQDPCTTAICESEIGCTWACAELPGCVLTCATDQDCDDQDPESLDTCVRRPCSSECRHSWPACDDDNPCTVDYRADGGACAHAPLHGESCDDGSACTTDDRCQQEQCVGQTVDCDDDNPCTSDYCDRVEGCLHENRPEGLGCDDGNLCTHGDTCQGGVCLGDEVVCFDEDGDNNCGEPYCDPAVGCWTFCGTGVNCQPECATDAECADDNPCTIDVCRQTTCRWVCRHLPDPCDDEDLCTVDTCLSSVGCQHERFCQPCERDRDCDDDNICTDDRCGDDSLCRHVPTQCTNDGDPCTTERCDPSEGCVFDCEPGCAPQCQANSQCLDNEDLLGDDGDLCTRELCVPGDCGNYCRREPLVCDAERLCDSPVCFGGHCLHTIRSATPSIDGVIESDWHSASAVAELEDGVAWGQASLHTLRVQYDADTFYVGVTGNAPTGFQAIVGYLDVDWGEIDPRDQLPAGIQYTANLGGVGDLDKAITGGVVFDAEHFGADFAFGTVGMTSAFGEADKAGWREIRAQTRPQRVEGSAILTSPLDDSLEAAVPLSVLWPAGIPEEGVRAAIVLLLVDIDAAEAVYAPVVLPPQEQPWPDETPTITNVFSFVVTPSLLSCCESDEDCRDGDLCTQDICTVGGQCTYVFGACR